MMSEISKLDEIDRKVLLWCARNQAQHIDHVMKLYRADYEKRGVPLNLHALISEVNKIVWNK